MRRKNRTALSVSVIFLVRMDILLEAKIAYPRNAHLFAALLTLR